jgi:hypothetical protein
MLLIKVKAYSSNVFPLLQSCIDRPIGFYPWWEANSGMFQDGNVLLFTVKPMRWPTDLPRKLVMAQTSLIAFGGVKPLIVLVILS